MDERETDKLLTELFKRNAPSVNEPALDERFSARLRRRRRRSRRSQTARAVALGFASVVLAGVAAFGTYEAVHHFRSEPALVFVELNLVPGGTSIGSASDGGPLLVRVSPVAGTAVLDQVKSEGTRDPADGADGVHRVRGRVEVYRLSTSQPAIDGTVEITSDLAMRPDGGSDITGSWVLRTDQGAWEGSSWRGNLTADGMEQFYLGTATGTGGFAGLTLLLQWHVVNSQSSPAAGAGSSEPVAVSGWIQWTR